MHVETTYSCCLLICLVFCACIDGTFESESSAAVCGKKSDTRGTKTNGEKKQSESLVLPVPPHVRTSRAKSRLEVLQTDEVEERPKYVRLPAKGDDKVGFEKQIEILPGINRTIKTLSLTPRIYEIADFFDEDECDIIVELAKRKKLKSHVDKSVNSIIDSGPEKTFHSWDINDDGFVDSEEIAFVTGKSLKFSVEDASDMIFMLKMDKDEDGKIDLKELQNTDLQAVKGYIANLKEEKGRKREMKSDNAWVWHDDDELLRFQDDYFFGYHARFTSVTGLPEEIVEESEPLQVENFKEDQFSQCKRDSDELSDSTCCLYGERDECRNCRYITIGIFLNDVEEGGELVFPLADHQFTDIMKSSGEWRGYFTYSKTTGSQNRFTANITFTQKAANQMLIGEGRDSSGKFDITDGIILGNNIRFQKSYSSTTTNSNDIIYSGKIISGSRILGNWWVPGRKRLFGTFFMWNRNYEMLLRRASAECNHNDYCANTGLVVRPKKGKALFWFNHETDYQTGMLGERDNDSLFGHCAVGKGEKWIATARVNVIGDGDVDLRAWRRGFNWMQNIDKYPNIMKKIGSTESRTKIEQYKEDFERFKFDENKNENRTVSHGHAHSRPAPSPILNAVNILLNEVDKEGLSKIAAVVHKKLRLTCVPFHPEDKPI